MCLIRIFLYSSCLWGIQKSQNINDTHECRGFLIPTYTFIHACFVLHEILESQPRTSSTVQTKVLQACKQVLFIWADGRVSCAYVFSKPGLWGNSAIFIQWITTETVSASVSIGLQVEPHVVAFGSYRTGSVWPSGRLLREGNCNCGLAYSANNYLLVKLIDPEVSRTELTPSGN